MPENVYTVRFSFYVPVTTDTKSSNIDLGQDVSTVQMGSSHGCAMPTDKPPLSKDVVLRKEIMIRIIYL